jgi:hypothetical protein
VRPASTGLLGGSWRTDDYPRNVWRTHVAGVHVETGVTPVGLADELGVCDAERDGLRHGIASVNHVGRPGVGSVFVVERRTDDEVGVPVTVDVSASDRPPRPVAFRLTENRHVGLGEREIGGRDGTVEQVGRASVLLAPRGRADEEVRVAVSVHVAHRGDRPAETIVRRVASYRRVTGREIHDSGRRSSGVLLILRVLLLYFRVVYRLVCR